MSLDHEKVFKIAKQDMKFRQELVDSGQKMPVWSSGTLEKGIWAAGYAGWILGTYGAEAYKHLHSKWSGL